jgi:hypothetical protein
MADGVPVGSKVGVILLGLGVEGEVVVGTTLGIMLGLGVEGEVVVGTTLGIMLGELVAVDIVTMRIRLFL